jgi:adenylate kinase family enzyme
VLELDQIHWDNSANEYNTKAPETTRDKQLEEFVSGEGWVVEGIYYKWTDISFKNSDVLIILITPNWLRNIRIIKRFILSKFGLSKSNEGSIKDVIALIKWGNSYNDSKLYQIEKLTEKYIDKRQFIHSADAFLKQIKI